MSLRHLLALLPLLVASCSRDGGKNPVDPSICASMIACATATDDIDLAYFVERFTPETGTCWSDLPDFTCVERCQEELDVMPWTDDPRCDDVVPSEDCLTLSQHETLCPEAQDQTIPPVCGDRPEKEECLADAVQICDEDIDNRLFACAFL